MAGSLERVAMQLGAAKSTVQTPIGATLIAYPRPPCLGAAPAPIQRARPALTVAGIQGTQR